MGELLLYHTPKGNEEGYGEVDNKAVENGQDSEPLTTGMGDDGQRGIHGSGATHRDGSLRTKEACQQRRAQKGDSLTHKVGNKGNSAQFDTAIFGKKNARQRVVGKATADSKTIGKCALQHQEGNSCARPRPQDGGQWQQGYTGVERPKIGQRRNSRPATIPININAITISMFSN